MSRRPQASHQGEEKLAVPLKDRPMSMPLNSGAATSSCARPSILASAEGGTASTSDPARRSDFFRRAAVKADMPSIGRTMPKDPFGPKMVFPAQISLKQHAVRAESLQILHKCAHAH